MDISNRGNGAESLLYVKVLINLADNEPRLTRRTVLEMVSVLHPD